MIEEDDSYGNGISPSIRSPVSSGSHKVGRSFGTLTRNSFQQNQIEEEDEFIQSLSESSSSSSEGHAPLPETRRALIHDAFTDLECV